MIMEPLKEKMDNSSAAIMQSNNNIQHHASSSRNDYDRSVDIEIDIPAEIIEDRSVFEKADISNTLSTPTKEKIVIINDFQNIKKDTSD